jgi:hypothetical protein
LGRGKGKVGSKNRERKEGEQEREKSWQEKLIGEGCSILDLCHFQESTGYQKA